MRHSKVAGRYAKSLLDLVNERGELDRAQVDMELIAGTIDANRELRILLKSPIIKADKKIKILDEIFKDELSVLSHGFIQIITDKGRERLLGDIAHEFVHRAKNQREIFAAEVESAAPLSDELRNQILALVKKMQPGDIELKESVDKDLIGGFVLRVGDQMIDASVASKLVELKREFTDNPYIPEI